MAAGHRFTAFDALRACAMEFGLVLHAGVPYTQRCPSAWAVCDPSRSGVFDLANTLIHAVRMPVFFLMSGFFAVLLIERVGARAFVAHRMRRIALPFLIACAVIVPITRAVWIFGAFARPEGAVSGRFWPSLVAHFQTEGIAVFETVWHLWFLEYLLLLTGVFVVVRFIVSRLPGAARLDAAAGALVSRGRALWLAIPTAVAMGTMKGWNVDGVSEIVPSLHMLAYYGLFFVAGVLLYRMQDRLEPLRRDWQLHLVAALAIVLPLMMWLSSISAGTPTPLVDAAGRLLSGVLTCLLLFGVVGLFIEYFGEPSPRQRYLSDAAYFVYLIHFPFIALLGIGFAHADWPAVLKFVAVLGIAVPTLLVAYRYGVRYTPIGRVLNGPRERPRAN